MLWLITVIYNNFYALASTCAKILAQNDANTFSHNSPADRDKELFKPSKDVDL